MVKKRPDLGSTRDFLGRFLSVNDSEQWTAASGQWRGEGIWNGR
jgi:hypothetical protein